MEERLYPYYTEQTNELFKALAQAQGEFHKAELDSTGGFKGKDGKPGKYASYESLKNATKEALKKYGLSIKQDPGYVDGQDALFTTLAHESGQYSTSFMILRTAGPDMQKLGGAITYGRRYAYASILGIADAEDDDGESNRESFEQENKKSTYPVSNAYSEKQADLIDKKYKYAFNALKNACADLGIESTSVNRILEQLKTKEDTKSLLDLVSVREELLKNK